MPAGGGDAVRLAPVLHFHAANPAALFKTGDGPVERSRPQADIGETLDVFHHGVAVFFAIGQAGEDEECWIGHRVTPYVVSYNVITNGVNGAVPDSCIDPDSGGNGKLQPG